MFYVYPFPWSAFLTDAFEVTITADNVFDCSTMYVCFGLSEVKPNSDTKG